MVNDKDFLLARNFDGKPYCHMKFRNPNGGMPSKFGVIYRERINTVRIIKPNGDFTGEEFSYSSVDEMLASGWMVD